MNIMKLFLKCLFYVIYTHDLFLYWSKKTIILIFCCFEVLYCIWMHPGGDFVYFIIIFNSRLFIIILYRMLRFAYIITINGHPYHAVPRSYKKMYFIQCICTNFNEFFWIALKYFCCVYICESSHNNLLRLRLRMIDINKILARNNFIHVRVVHLLVNYNSQYLHFIWNARLKSTKRFLKVICTHKCKTWSL